MAPHDCSGFIMSICFKQAANGSPCSAELVWFEQMLYHFCVIHRNVEKLDYAEWQSETKVNLKTSVMLNRFAVL